MQYYSIFGRMDQFLAGMLCAIVYVRHDRVANAMRYLFPLAAAMVLGWLTLFNQMGGFEVQHVNRMVWPTADAIVWGFFLLCYLPLSQRVPRLISDVVGWMGECSFSVYLVHFPVVQALIHLKCMIRISDDWEVNAIANSVLVLLPVVYAVSAATYYLIEKPFLQLRRSYLTPLPEPPQGAAGVSTPAAAPVVPSTSPTPGT